MPSLMRMAEAFVTEAWAGTVPFNPATAGKLLRALIGGQEGFLLCDFGCTAMIGVAIHAWHFNEDVRTATELFWWSEPGASGLALLEAAEERVHQLGIDTIHAARLETMRPMAVEALYLRRGYRPTERIFVKELG